MHIDEAENVKAVLVKSYWYNVAGRSFSFDGDAYCDKTNRWCSVYRFDYARDSRRFDSELLSMKVLGDLIDAVQYEGGSK